MRDGNLLPRKQRTAERILVGDAAGAERRGEERSERTVKGSGREREREREMCSHCLALSAEFRSVKMTIRSSRARNSACIFRRSKSWMPPLACNCISCSSSSWKHLLYTLSLSAAPSCCCPPIVIIGPWNEDAEAFLIIPLWNVITI